MKIIIDKRCEQLYLDERISSICINFNVRESQPRWLSRWNWLDCEENCSSLGYIPSVWERERGKVLRKGRIVISAKCTPSLLLTREWCCDSESQRGVSRREKSSFLRLGSLHTLSAKRFPSRYYIRFRDESDCSQLRFTWKRKADPRVRA